jgi:hypothetical protein
MNLAPVEAIVKAVLYEGYILYPYRASNVKNRQRWTFGGVYPRQQEGFACDVQGELTIAAAGVAPGVFRLTVRIDILAMTDEEKRDMAALDARARALLERTQALTAADMGRLHGTRRQFHSRADPEVKTLSTERPLACKPELAFLHAGGRGLAVGDRVRLHPKGRADIFDLVLKDEMAVIEAIERDFDNKIHVAVVLEADPGREFGLDRMPGHRFFFSPDEIEPAGKESTT